MPALPALTLYSVPPVEEAPNNSLPARRAGFSLHAATVCEAWQRSRLERLCRYITRLTYTAEAPFSFPGGGLLIGFQASPPAIEAHGGC